MMFLEDPICPQPNDMEVEIRYHNRSVAEGMTITYNIETERKAVTIIHLTFSSTDFDFISLLFGIQ